MRLIFKQNSVGLLSNTTQKSYNQVQKNVFIFYHFWIIKLNIKESFVTKKIHNVLLSEGSYYTNKRDLLGMYLFSGKILF